MAGAVARYPGKVWASGVVPLQDTKRAVEELERAMKMGLVGVNVPGSIGPRGKTHIDDPSLEPFYDRAEKLGAMLFLHPTDVVFPEICDGKDGALYAATPDPVFAPNYDDYRHLARNAEWSSE